MKRERTTLLLGGFLTVLAMLWFITQVRSSREQGRVPRSDTNTAVGLKIFSDLKEKLSPGSVTQWRRPFLKDEDLDRFDTLILVSPVIPLSSREEKIVDRWLEEGGNLVVTAENEIGLRRVQHFITRAAIPDLIDDTPGFVNDQTSSYVPKADGGLFKKDETYEAYSPIRFQDATCLGDPASCWIRVGTVGNGTVTLILGISPMANAMIDRADNKKLAARFALGSKRTAFDEYHLLITEKTTGDLLSDPSFLLPILGMLVGVLLYFIAGGDESAKELIAPKRRRARTLHEFGRRVLARTLEKPAAMKEAVIRHAQFFSALAPNERQNIEQIVNPARNARLGDDVYAQIAMRLAEHHKNWLKSKGRK